MGTSIEPVASGYFLTANLVLDPLDEVDVLAELSIAEELLRSRMVPGQGDPWVYCDLGTIQLLRGANWLPEVHQLEKLRPRDFVYDDSWLGTLSCLNELASSVRPELADAIRHVERAARYTR